MSVIERQHSVGGIASAIRRELYPSLLGDVSLTSSVCRWHDYQTKPLHRVERFPVRTGQASSGTKDVFVRLLGQWREATLFSSSFSEKVLSPDFQAIVGLGRRAVPWILETMMTDASPELGWALRSITREDPAATAVTAEAARDAWLEWGTTKAYI